MKLFVMLFLALLVSSGIWIITHNEPQIAKGSTVSACATVTDRAISDGMRYLSVKLPDGNALCLWDPQADTIPEGISTGDAVEVTYSKQEGFDRYILINVKMDTD